MDFQWCTIFDLSKWGRKAGSYVPAKDDTPTQNQ
jgi:hypothetical protein